MSLVNEDYTVAWVSALPDELAAAQALLDEEHEDLPAVPGDHNAYTLGRIAKHNVVIAGLPRGAIGTTPAASVAANLLRSFPNVKFGLMVGIGGGVPDAVRLGDIVVSNPEGQSGGVIQYDFGTSTPGIFIRKGALPGTPAAISTAITKLSALARRKGYKFNTYYEEMLTENPIMEDFRRPADDVLYHKDYIHVGNKADCSKCDPARIIERAPHTKPVVHYGLIGSGNSVIRDATQRNELYEREGIICFEMEAAGLMKDFPCLVIRGICDYCDTHKNKRWQPYAGGIAAAYAKELLMTIPAYAIAAMPHNELFEAVRQQTLEIRALHNTQQDAHETAKEAYSALQNINTKLQEAERRVSEEKSQEYLRCLNATDSRVDRVRIEDVKGGLLRDAYKWILQNKEYLDWYRDGRLLWIRGDPGKGKTMLLCGIINELENELNNGPYETLVDSLERKLVYFFCQAANSVNNSASAVFRGLIYSILQQSPSLIDTVRDKLDKCNNTQTDNNLYVLRDIFETLLKDLNLYILVDALDECIVHRDKLLEVICRSSQSNKARWIVTSRNWNDIGQYLNNTSSIVPQLSLELNAESVSQAVVIYINHKVTELTSSHKYDNDLRNFVRDYLIEHANGTFLWVALVCARLAKVRQYRIRNALTDYTTGLDEVYDRMITTIEESGDEYLLKQTLRTVSTVFEPIHLDELPSLMELPDELLTNMVWLEELIGDCGSFLTIRRNRIEFVHQSAKDYIDKRLIVTSIAKSQMHFQIYNSSIQAMIEILQRNMYHIGDPGTHIKDIVQPSPDPLLRIRYCCKYWVQHFKADGVYEQNSTVSLLCFLRQSYLYWLEIMILTGTLRKALHLLRDLEILATEADLKSFVIDAYRFAFYFKDIIEKYPLQLYYTGLVFSPMASKIRTAFQGDLSQEMKILHDTIDFSWPQQTVDIECGGKATAIRYSHNGAKFVVADMSGKIQIFDTVSGELIQPVLFYPSDKMQQVSDYEIECKCQKNSFKLFFSGYQYSLFGLSDLSTVTFVSEIAFRPDDSMLLITLESVIFAMQGKHDLQSMWQCFRGKGHNPRRRKFYVWDFSTRQWNFIREFPTCIKLTVADRGARWIAYSDSSTSNQEGNCLFLYDIDTSTNKLLFADAPGQIVNIVFSSDNSHVAGLSDKGYIFVRGISTTVTIDAQLVSDKISCLALCSTGTKIAIVKEESPHSLIVYEISSGGVLWSLDLETEVTDNLDFSPDGDALILHNGSICEIFHSSTGIRSKYQPPNQDMRSDTSRRLDVSSTFEFGRRYYRIALSAEVECRLYIVEVAETESSVECSDKSKSSESICAIHCAPHATDMLLRYESRIDIWNIEIGSMILRLTWNHPIQSCEIFEYLNGYILIIYDDSNSGLSSTTKCTLKRLKNHHIKEEMIKYDVVCWGVSQSGSLIAFTNESKDIFIENIEDQEPVQLRYDRDRCALQYPNKLNFSASEDRIVGLVQCEEADMAIVWDTRNGRQLVTITLGHPDSQRTLSVSPSGQSLFSRSGEDEIIYYLQTGELEHLGMKILRDVPARVYWSSLTTESNKSSWRAFQTACGCPDIDFRSIILQFPRKTGIQDVRVPPAPVLPQTICGGTVSIHTPRGVISIEQGKPRYGTSKDVYIHEEWIYKEGRPFLWIPLPFRARWLETAYASQCLLISPNSLPKIGGFVMLKFDFNPNDVECSEEQTDTHQNDNCLLSTTIGSLDRDLPRIGDLVLYELSAD